MALSLRECGHGILILPHFILGTVYQKSDRKILMHADISRYNSGIYKCMELEANNTHIYLVVHIMLWNMKLEACTDDCTFDQYYALSVIKLKDCRHNGMIFLSSQLSLLVPCHYRSIFMVAVYQLYVDIAIAYYVLPFYYCTGGKLKVLLHTHVV